MKRLLQMALPSVLVGLLTLPGSAEAQRYSSLGAGLAVPVGDMSDVYDTGWTVRGQTGLSFVLVDAHVQTGWSRFPGKDYTAGGVTVSAEDINVYHAGVGARVGLGLVWVGANAAYFFGDLDDDGLGLFPEVGAHIGPIEAVVDYRIDGEVNWLGARVGLRF
jgi:hypothetical protein